MLRVRAWRRVRGPRIAAQAEAARQRALPSLVAPDRAPVLHAAAEHIGAAPAEVVTRGEGLLGKRRGPGQPVGRAR